MLGLLLKGAGYYYRYFPHETYHLLMSRHFASRASASACAEIYTIPMWSDNYCYVLVDRVTKAAAIVDPGEPNAVVIGLEKIDCKVEQVFCTHKHDDHANGNEHLKGLFPDLRIMTTKHEPIPAATDLLTEGDEFTLGSLSVRVLYVPCHTAGHIAFVVSGSSGSSILCSGDTLFVGGCGRFFEGTAAQMLANMDKFAALPDDTLVCCAHEYTESNFKFLASVDPERCGAQYELIKSIRAGFEPTVPSTIGDEKRYNLFMNCRDESVQSAVGCLGSPEQTMATLRERKNNFR